MRGFGRGESTWIFFGEPLCTVYHLCNNLCWYSLEPWTKRPLDEPQVRHSRGKSWAATTFGSLHNIYWICPAVLEKLFSAREVSFPRIYISFGKTDEIQLLPQVDTSRTTKAKSLNHRAFHFPHSDQASLYRDWQSWLTDFWKMHIDVTILHAKNIGDL